MMKLSRLLVLGLLCSLVSCSGLANMPTIEEADPRNNNHIDDDRENRENEAEVEDSFINRKYIGLLDIVERTRMYIEEEASMPYPDLSILSPVDKETWLSRLKSIRVNQINFVKQLNGNTLDLLNGKQTADSYLFFLLKRRLEYLSERDEAISDYLSIDYRGPASIIPTSQDLSNFLAQADPDYIKDYNEQLRLAMVTKFELLNLFIRETFSQCSLEELKPETINLLRMSVQLHPILTGERKDLGHPDEAGGYYAILEPIMFTSSKKFNQVLPNLRKEFNVLKERPIFKDSFGIPANKKGESLNFLRLLVDNIRNKEQKEREVNIDRPGEITQELLSIKQNLDIAVYKAHVDRQVKYFQLRNLGTPIGPKHRVRTEPMTDYEFGSWPYELPNPAFLRNPQQAVVTTENLLPANDLVSEVNYGLATAEKTGQVKPRKEGKLKKRSIKQAAKPIVKKKSYQEKLAKPVLPSSQQEEIYKEESIEPVISTDQQQEEISIKVSKQEEVKEEQPIKPVDLPTKQDLEAIIKENGPDQNSPEEALRRILASSKQEVVDKEQPTKEEEVKVVEKGVNPSLNSVPENWEWPRGLRVFHSQMPPPYPKRLTDNRNQKVVDRLFDSQQQCNVSFGEFKSVWLRIGGDIEGSSGGSHKEFVCPERAQYKKIKLGN